MSRKCADDVKALSPSKFWKMFDQWGSLSSGWSNSWPAEGWSETEGVSFLGNHDHVIDAISIVCMALLEIGEKECYSQIFALKDRDPNFHWFHPGVPLASPAALPTKEKFLPSSGHPDIKKNSPDVHLGWVIKVIAQDKSGCWPVPLDMVWAKRPFSVAFHPKL